MFRGFFRLNKGFGIFLWVLFTVSFFWFGAFASAGGTAIAKLTNLPVNWTVEGQTRFWGQVSIVVFTVAILYAKTAYRLIEWIMKIVAIISLVGMTWACCSPEVWTYLGEFLKGLAIPDVAAMHTFDPRDSSRLLTAVTFAGLGGFWTLFYSYWIKEKGIGMAAHMEHITGFRSGVAAIRRGKPALPQESPDAEGRLRQWYRYLSVETLVGIAGNLATTLMTCLLSFALLRPEGKLPQGFEIAVVQADFFAVAWGDTGRILFLVIAGAFLADTWLATADCVSRVHLDAITTIWPKLGEENLRPWYYGIILLLAVLTSVTMYLERPGPLIIVSALIGFAGTVIYSTALIVLNHFRLPRQLGANLRPGLASLGAMIFVTSCYLVLAALYLWFQFGR